MINLYPMNRSGLTGYNQIHIFFLQRCLFSWEEIHSRLSITVAIFAEAQTVTDELAR